MKKRLFLMLVFIPVLMSAQSRWSAPVTISVKEVAPDFDIDQNTGSLHIVTIGNWFANTFGVTYTVLDSLGVIRHQEKVPGAEEDNGGWNFGAAVDVDPQGYPHICYRKSGEYQKYMTFYTSRNASGWGSTLQLSEALYRGYMIRVAVDDSDRAHIARGRALNAPLGDVTYMRIRNGAVTRTIGGLDTARTDDRHEIDVSPDGHVHLLMGCPNAVHGPVTYYRSLDGGETMERVGDIHSPRCFAKNGSPDVFIDRSGIVHMCYGAEKDQDRGGLPSVRYVRYENGLQVRHVPVTRQGVLVEDPPGDEGWGLGSVAASEDGQCVGIAYLTQGGGDLYFTLSTDAGETWSEPEFIASGVGSGDGRSMQLLRAFRNHFYLVYPVGQDVVMTAFRNAGDNPPTAFAGGPYTGVEGSPVLFDGSGSADTGSRAGLMEYAWDFENDGIWDVLSASSSVSHTYPDDFTGTVRLKVTDRSGAVAEDTARIIVRNVSPIVSIGPDMDGTTEDNFHIIAVVNDPGSDTFIGAWDFGDGSSGTSLTADHRYGAIGTFRVVFSVSDGDGGIGRDTCVVTVRAAAEKPSPFSLIDPLFWSGTAWPDTIRFRWHRANAKDPVQYHWILREQTDISDTLRNVTVIDTSFAFIPVPGLSAGTYLWNVDAVESHGLKTTSDGVGILHVGASGISAESGLPDACRLFQNYPNPFNPSTRIDFSLSKSEETRIVVFNSIGQCIRVLWAGRKSAGFHSVEWDARDDAGNRVQSGTYLVRLESGKQIRLGKMVVMQ